MFSERSSNDLMMFLIVECLSFGIHSAARDQRYTFPMGSSGVGFYSIPCWDIVLWLFLFLCSRAFGIVCNGHETRVLSAIMTCPGFPETGAPSVELLAKHRIDLKCMDHFTAAGGIKYTIRRATMIGGVASR